jgi:hypothetical protein
VTDAVLHLIVTGNTLELERGERRAEPETGKGKRRFVVAHLLQLESLFQVNPAKESIGIASN